jgi:hypothetical protein
MSWPQRVRRTSATAIWNCPPKSASPRAPTWPPSRDTSCACTCQLLALRSTRRAVRATQEGSPIGWPIITGRERENNRLVGPRSAALAVVVTAAAAWAALVWLGDGVSHHHLGSSHGHTGTTHSATHGPWPLGPVLVGWALMVVAMMLPTALPMLDHLSPPGHKASVRNGFGGVGRGKIHRCVVIAGVALIAADLGLRNNGEGVDWFSAHPTVVPGGANRRRSLPARSAQGSVLARMPVTARIHAGALAGEGDRPGWKQSL